MSKLAVFVGVPTALAVVGLAIWNVQLQGEIEDLRVQRDVEANVEHAVATGHATSDPAARSGARSGSRREEARSQAFDDRLRALEAQAAAAPVAEAAGARAAPESDSELSADLPEMLRHADFGRAVNEVIDARDEARRKERLEREAEQRTRRMLRDLEVTDAQRADVLAATQNYMLRRDEARRAAGDDPDREARREAGQALEADWHAALSGILDATQLESALKRTERRQGPNRADPRRQRPNRESPRRRGGEQQQ